MEENTQKKIALTFKTGQWRKTRKRKYTKFRFVLILHKIIAYWYKVTTTTTNIRSKKLAFTARILVNNTTRKGKRQNTNVCEHTYSTAGWSSGALHIAHTVWPMNFHDITICISFSLKKGLCDDFLILKWESFAPAAALIFFLIGKSPWPASILLWQVRASRTPTHKKKAKNKKHPGGEPLLW